MYFKSKSKCILLNVLFYYFCHYRIKHIFLMLYCYSCKQNFLHNLHSNINVPMYINSLLLQTGYKYIYIYPCHLTSRHKLAAETQARSYKQEREILFKQDLSPIAVTTIAYFKSVIKMKKIS